MLAGCPCCVCRGKSCLIPHPGHDHRTMPGHYLDEMVLHKWGASAHEDGIAKSIPAPPAVEWIALADMPPDTRRHPVILGLIHQGKLFRCDYARYNGLGWYTVHGGKLCDWGTHYIEPPAIPAHVATPAPLPKVGQWARYQGDWGWVFSVSGANNEIGLSGWRGVKTTWISREQVQKVQDQNPFTNK